jgi:hypothetical protein
MIKKFLNITLAFALVGLSSCSDFLEQTSESEYTADVVFSTTAYTESAIYGIYAIMTEDPLYSSRLSLMYCTNSDIEITAADASSYNQQGNRGISNYMAQASWSGHLDRTWTALYKAIERANLAIAEIPKSAAFTNESTSKAMKSFLGEAYALRALYYFELVRHWGDVPFKTEPTLSDGSNFYPEVSDRDAILEYLLKDLDVAVSYLDWGNKPERITKGFALGLQARIALSRGGYSIRNKPGFPTERGSNYLEYYKIANAACAKIINEGPHKLNPSYIQIFKNLCKLTTETTYNENLFEAAMGFARSSEMGYSIGVRFRTNPKYGYGNNANVVSTTPYYFYQFDPKDLRRDVSVAIYEYRPNDKKKNVPMEVVVGGPYSWTIGKYDQRWMSDQFLATNLPATGKIGSGINWVMMRYSDVLLMFAETENEINGGPTDAAKQALKSVRTRAFAEADQKTKVQDYVDALTGKDEFFQAVANERMFEFGGEGIRKYDLIRWNLLGTNIEIQRQKFAEMLSTGVFENLSGQTVTTPSALHFKYNADGETLDISSFNFYEDKGTDPIPGYEDPVKFLKGYTEESKATYLDVIAKFSSGLNTPVQNRHLYPIYQEVVSQSNGTITNSYQY